MGSNQILDNWTDPNLPDTDVVIMTNAESSFGTSFSAPCALAYIQRVMNETDLSAKQALLAAKNAAINHSDHLLFLTDIIEEANIIIHGPPPPTSTSTYSIRLYFQPPTPLNRLVS